MFKKFPDIEGLIRDFDYAPKWNIKNGIKNYCQWKISGIRAQLLNIREKKLEMDFMLEEDDSSMHILNAVSPGFTCTLPFAEYICDKIDSKLS